jgi:colanic acid/amylovoran biosynthesis protein
MSFCDVEDLKICDTIRERSGLDIPVYSGLSASEAKAIIKSCYVVFSSRYHGVVSALNQNVPCMSSSWSHKYEELLIGYRMEGFLTGKTTNETIHIFNKLLDRDYNKAIRIKLQELNTENYNATNKMWDQVFSIVE